MCRFLFGLSELSMGKHILSQKSPMRPEKVNGTHAIHSKYLLHNQLVRGPQPSQGASKKFPRATAADNTWNYLTDNSTN